MKKVLVIYTSPTFSTKKGSISSLLADEFISFYKQNNDDKIIKLNLNDLNYFSEPMKTEYFKDTEENSNFYLKQLLSVDKLIIATSMINFNYPAVLQNYIDKVLFHSHISNPNKNQNIKILKHLKTQLLITKGADNDMHKWINIPSMLKQTFEFLGAHVLEPIIISGTQSPNLINVTPENIIKLHHSKIIKSIKNF